MAVGLCDRTTPMPSWPGRMRRAGTCPPRWAGRPAASPEYRASGRSSVSVGRNHTRVTSTRSRPHDIESRARMRSATGGHRIDDGPDEAAGLAHWRVVRSPHYLPAGIGFHFMRRSLGTSPCGDRDAKKFASRDRLSRSVTGSSAVVARASDRPKQPGSNVSAQCQSVCLSPSTGERLRIRNEAGKSCPVRSRSESGHARAPGCGQCHVLGAPPGARVSPLNPGKQHDNE